MLENTPSQPSKFRTKNWVEVNYESCGTYNVNSQIRFKTSMLRPILCNSNDAYILVNATLTGRNTVVATGEAENNRKNIMIKNWTPLTNCISEINNTQIDNAKDIDIVMPLNTLIEYSDNYSKTSESLWNYYGDEPFLDNGSITNFPTDNIKSASFKFKTKIADRAENDGTKNVKIRVPLKYLSGELLKCH